MDNTDPAHTNLNIWLLYTSKNVSSLDNNFNIYNPVISPDKSMLAFVSDESGNRELYIVNLTIDGNAAGNYTKLTYDSKAVQNPVWNADSTKLAFSREVNGECNIWIIDRDGSNLRPVTVNFKGAYEPDWNFTTGEIMFRSFKNGFENLYTLRISDNAVRQITFNIEKGSHFFANPSWNQAEPNQIAFDRNTDGNIDIYIMNRDLTSLYRVTNKAARDWNPCFSHDGKRIFFNSNRRSRDDIYSINNKDSLEDELIYENGYLRIFNNTFENDISLSPDSRDIYFVRYFNEKWRIFRCQALHYMTPVKWDDSLLREEAMIFNLIDSKR
jgi:TolB protein